MSTLPDCCLLAGVHRPEHAPGVGGAQVGCGGAGEGRYERVAPSEPEQQPEWQAKPRLTKTFVNRRRHSLVSLSTLTYEYLLYMSS